jgi:zinc finger protein
MPKSANQAPAAAPSKPAATQGSAVVERTTAELGGQDCPMCRAKELTLTEAEADIPFFGKAFIFSMSCSKCKYHRSDVESAAPREPAQYTLEVAGSQDLQVRVVRSSEGTVLMQGIGSIEPGPEAQGWVTNIEGVITRMREQIEYARNEAEDFDSKAKAQALIDRLDRVIAGKEKLTLTIKDPSGNSAIISERAVRKKL